MRNRNDLREQLINGLFVMLNETDDKEEQRLISDCMTLLINGRTPEQVKKMEIERHLSGK